MAGRKPIDDDRKRKAVTMNVSTATSLLTSLPANTLNAAHIESYPRLSGD